MTDASIALSARFEVGQNSAKLLGNTGVRQSGSAELLGKFEAQATAELLSKADVRQSGSAELLGKFEAQATADLPGRALIRHVGSPVDLLGEAVIRQPDSAELPGKAEVQHADSAELLGKFEAQATAELLSKADVRQSGSAEPLGKGIIRHVGTPVELLGRFVVRHIGTPIELLGKGIIRHVGTPVELLGRFVVRHIGTPIELLSQFIVRHKASVELSGNVVIRHTGIPRELVARFVVRHSATKNLGAEVEIVHWEDLCCKSVIRHTATPLNLPAIFWVRWPSRLWTSRRYINGVIELDEKLLGDASLEYVIEGVMEDTQGYLDNAGLSYSEWTGITLVPVQILRAVTYGTVAALYARHTQTFRSQVVPSITPVTVTVIGDAEKALNYWEDRMDQMLEFYVTSQGGDVMLTSTPDEEPVFSMEDIPEEVTEYVSWRIWLQERGN